ncbi:hypothetical protein HII13_001433 [Brettanomyces bruxellensis]|nr:hypothetical protein HII13_001433 [Brettanomyces bruxellensis]
MRYRLLQYGRSGFSAFMWRGCPSIPCFSRARFQGYTYQKRNFSSFLPIGSPQNQTENKRYVGSVYEKVPQLKQLVDGMPKRDLPYYEQLMAFDECLAHNSSFESSSGKMLEPEMGYWNAVKQVMPLYEELLPTGELDEHRVDELVSLLRNGLRVYRWELVRLRKNVDRDVNSPLKRFHKLLAASLLQIGNDLVANNSPLTISSRGATNLFKAYGDLGFGDEASKIWSRAKDKENLKEAFTAESALGSIFSLLVDTENFDYEETWLTYGQIKAQHTKSEGDYIHGELQLAVLRACLIKGHLERASDIFSEITAKVIMEFKKKNEVVPSRLLGYMTKGHLDFIGFCTDYSTARTFFDAAIRGQLPYPIPLQMEAVKRFMLNTYSATRSLEKVEDIWISSWKFYQSHSWSNSSMSSTLNNTFMEIFFDKHDTFNEQAALDLQHSLSLYNEVKPFDEPLFNCLLIQSMVWKSKPFFKSVIQASNMYNFPKTSVFYRCCLKATGVLNVAASEIFDLFSNLLDSDLAMGASKITNADWFALRDATIRSRNVSSDKIDLYFRMWKLCSPYFTSMKNFRMYMRFDIKENKNYSKVFNNIDSVDTRDVNLPQLSRLSANKEILDYYRERMETRTR